MQCSARCRKECHQGRGPSMINWTITAGPAGQVSFFQMVPSLSS
jgi:ribosomal protein L24E